MATQFLEGRSLIPDIQSHVNVFIYDANLVRSEMHLATRFASNNNLPPPNGLANQRNCF